MPKTPRVKSIRVRRRRPTCLGCSLRGLQDQCHYGTLAGNCTKCGQHKATLSVSDLNPHFSQVPNSLSEVIRQAQAIAPFQPDGFPNSLLRVQTRFVADGTNRTHTLVVPGGGYNFEKQMRDEMDLLVRKFSCPNKHCTEPRTQLCQAAFDVGGYLAFLLSPVVKERRATMSNREDEDEDEVRHGTGLALHFVPFLLSRLDDLIGLVMDAFGRGQTNDDQEYWTDVCTAAAILYKGLDGVHSNLVMQNAGSFCGGGELTAHLRNQVKSTADNLMTALLDRGLGCSAPLASHINAFLDNLQCSILVESVTLTQEIHPVILQTMGESQASSATTSSSYQSPELDQVLSASITDGYNDFIAFDAPNVHSIPSTQYLEPITMSYPAPMVMQYQVPELSTPNSANSQLYHQTIAGPRHSCPHGPASFQSLPRETTASRESMQKPQYQPTSYKPVHHSNGPIWPLPTYKAVPVFGDGWPDATELPIVNPGHTPDYFGNDSFMERNPQEDEYYSPPMSFYVSSADMLSPPPETSIPMTPQFSAPFWSEQQYVTWRQS
ncbi:hypothetical protein N431DRAFT_422780 [Stipitochalara longipes BDJ]|nr:hypothetical protein N431DRAFT_422780 [Stipitochalara longipes BDJ]